MKKRFLIEYSYESGELSTSMIFASDETEVRKIFRRLSGDTCRIKSINKYETRPVVALQLEFE